MSPLKHLQLATRSHQAPQNLYVNLRKWRPEAARIVTVVQSKGPNSQLILVMDNFHCTCYCWSSEPNGKEKNDFGNIVMGHWIFFVNEDYDSVS